MIPHPIIVTIAVITVTAVAAIGFASGGYLIHLALICVPAYAYLISRPDIWFALIIGLSQSKLIFPGLPHGLHVIHVLMAGLTATLIGRSALRKAPVIYFKPMNISLILFLTVIVITALMRGFGIRALGSELWGGMSYIRLLLTGAFFITAQTLLFEEKLLKRAVIMMLGFSLIPALAQILFLATKGAIHQQFTFVEPYVGGLLESLQALETGRTVRFHMLGGATSTLLMFATILIWRRRGGGRILYTFLLISAVILAGLSGFRARILYVLFIIIVYALFENMRAVRRRLAFTIVIAIPAVLAIYLSAPYLPRSIQRAISWLPNISIEYDVRLEAHMSAISRILVWEMAWSEVPRYLWLGKGFAIDPLDFYSPTVRADWVLFSFVSHNYHSGPLSLLLDTGLPGFLFGSLFLFTSTVEIIRRRREVNGHSLLERAYSFFLANHIYHVLAFYLIFGDVRESFPEFFMNLSMMQAIINVVRKKESEHSLPTLHSRASV